MKFTLDQAQAHIDEHRKHGIAAYPPISSLPDGIERIRLTYDKLIAASQNSPDQPMSDDIVKRLGQLGGLTVRTLCELEQQEPASGEQEPAHME